MGYGRMYPSCIYGAYQVFFNADPVDSGNGTKAGVPRIQNISYRVYVYICGYLFVSTHISYFIYHLSCVYIYIYIYQMYIYVHMCMCMYIYIYTHIHIHVNTCVCVCVYVRYTYVRKLRMCQEPSCTATSPFRS